MDIGADSSQCAKRVIRESFFPIPPTLSNMYVHDGCAGVGLLRFASDSLCDSTALAMSIAMVGLIFFPPSISKKYLATLESTG